MELAEIGIKPTPSRTAELKDMGLTKGPLFGELFLPPLYIFDLTACWLVNMAAFEACTVSPISSSVEGYTVSPYICLLQMLMDREEDVHELRAKRIIHGEFTNQETLDYFKGLGNNLFIACRYKALLAQLEEYKHKRRVLIAIHKAVYSNFKIIVTGLPSVGVLVGIFKALL